MRNNILKTINLHEQFKFKPKNLIIYLVEVEYWKVKEKTQNCQVQVLKKKMQDIREIKKKVQPKKKTETSQNLFFFLPHFLFVYSFICWEFGMLSYHSCTAYILSISNENGGDLFSCF
jgi:hypothetical protein